MSKVEHKREDKANQKVKEALQKASHMFMGDIGKRVEEDELILKKKIELKTKNMFSTIDNEIPDYFIDERKRRKLLEDLKIKYRKRVRLPEDIQEEEEQKEKEKQDKLKDQKVEEDDDDDRKATSEVLAKIEEEKKDTALKKMIPAKFRKKVQAIEYKQESTDGKLVPYKPKEMALDLPSNASALNLANALNSNRNAIVLRKQRVVQPEWHAPWKLMRVISGHQGWVRAIAVDVTNKWFVTGSRDRTIKFWDLVEGNLLLTLTGHISTVRGL